MNHPAKEATAEARFLVGECRREAMFALISDVKETGIIKGLLDKLGDLEEKIEEIGGALKSDEPHWVRRNL